MGSSRTPIVVAEGLEHPLETPLQNLDLITTAILSSLALEPRCLNQSVRPRLPRCPQAQMCGRCSTLSPLGQKRILQG